jgi:tetratricopeptide (TPR) repeat protein
MKKSVLTSMILGLFLCSLLPGQDTTSKEEYIKAMTAPNANQKATLIKEWLSNYGGKGQENENFANATLCLLQYEGKTPAETIKYGEKALELGGLDDSTKCQVLIQLASTYSKQGQNLDKAVSYGSQLIQTAKSAKNNAQDSKSAESWNKMIGAGYYTQAQAMEKAGNLEGAIENYISSYNILKNKQIISELGSLGKKLYDNKQYSEAVKVFTPLNDMLDNFNTTLFYARALHRSGDKEEALKYYKEAFSKQKNGEVAYNIGLLLAEKAEKDPKKVDEALEYLLYASFLSKANSDKAMKLAEGLFFSTKSSYNEKVKELAAKAEELEKLTNTFNEKYGEKTEEDLSNKEKKEVEKMRKEITSLQESINKLQDEQKVELDKFNSLIEQIKKKLGIE